MHVIECDRCKTTIPAGRNNDLSIINIITADEGTKSFDLCPKCTHLVYKLLAECEVKHG